MHNSTYTQMLAFLNAQERTFGKLRSLLESTGWRINRAHRGDPPGDFLQLVEAVGDRMAHEEATAQRVPRALIDLHEAGAVLSDLAWYVENAGIRRVDWLEREQAAITRVMDELDDHLDAADVTAYAQAAITSEESWEAWVGVRSYIV